MLTREEVRAILAEIHGVPRLMMIYTHVLNRGPGAVRSPADRILGA